MEISYGLWTDALGDFSRAVEQWAIAHPEGAVCDVGGGANPVLPKELRATRRYVVLDADPGELAKCPADTEQRLDDITAAEFRPRERFDLVVSRKVAEHVADPRSFHGNIRSLLTEGGRARHLFPTMWAAPFVVNRMLPEQVSERVLLAIQPFRRPEGTDAKFPARYAWCRGPTPRQLRRFAELGYSVEEYVGYFGHEYYRHFAAPLMRVEAVKARLLQSRPIPQLTAYASVSLRRA